MKRRLAAGLVALLIVQTACATAKIVRYDAVDIEAKIAGGDADTVYVVDDRQRTFAVPRRTVRDIDHPGNVWMAGAAPLLAAGGVLAGAAMTANCRDDACGLLQALALVGALVYGGVGAGGFAIGYSQWAQSTAKAEPDAGPPDWLRGRPPPGIPLEPPVGSVPPIAAPVPLPQLLTASRP